MQDGHGKKGTAGGGAKETVTGTGYKQGDRVMVVGQDGEDRKTYRTATVATVRLMVRALYSLYAVCVGLCNFSSLFSVSEQRNSTVVVLVITARVWRNKACSVFTNMLCLGVGLGKR